jgi:hypothetical protein
VYQQTHFWKMYPEDWASGTGRCDGCSGTGTTEASSAPVFKVNLFFGTENTGENTQICSIWKRLPQTLIVQFCYKIFKIEHINLWAPHLVKLEREI